ncbi:MAG: hypothetical protein KA369_16460 [Spirochaetes bacterium]|nr:hypothetical protein [Spirochaetota bacterium]
MVQKILNAIGNIRLSFWLLMAAAALFITGMFYTSMDFAYFKTMNELRIQDWLARELSSRPAVNWWLPALITVLALLGLNTVACTFNRLRELAAGSSAKDYRFVISLLPSIVHMLFIAVMIGHAMTITMGSWTRIPLSEGAEIVINPSVPPLTVQRIADAYFPEGSRLSKRIMQTRVTLTGGDGGDISISYLESVRYKGYRLHLDMVKQKQGKARLNQPAQIVENKETCNRSETFRSKERKREPSQTVQLLVISDPGLPIIIAGFTLILVIMTWYFIEILRKRNEA